MIPAVFTVTFSMSGVSHSSGTVALTTSPQNGSFTDFALVPGPQPDPYLTHILNQAVDVSSSSSFVRVSTTATAPVGYVPYTPQTLVTGRAAYVGMDLNDNPLKASGSSYIDHAQIEIAASTTLLTADAEGYDAGMLYSLEPGVGALWERTQSHTSTGLYSGHFLASPAYSGNSYQKVSNFASYDQLLAANRTYADVLNGPS